MGLELLVFELVSTSSHQGQNDGEVGQVVNGGGEGYMVVFLSGGDLLVVVIVVVTCGSLDGEWLFVHAGVRDMEAKF